MRTGTAPKRTATPERNQAILGLLFVLPAFIVTLGIIAYPVIESIITSFTDPGTGAFSFANYAKLFSNPNSVENIVYTLRIVLWTVFLSVVISYPISLFITFGTGRLASLVGKLYLIPRFIPTIVAVYAIIGVVRDTGAINRLLLLFGISFKPGLMYTATGIIIANLWFNIPFSTMLISAAMSGIPKSMIESAQDVGAGKAKAFASIVLPLTAKSAVIAAVFVFMGNIGSFTTPFLMGTNAPRMLGVALYQEFSVFYDIPAAAALSVFMFVLSSFAGAVYIRSMMKEESWHAK